MKTTIKGILRFIYSIVVTLKDGGLIQIQGNGFWRFRRPPSKSLRKAAKLFNELEGKIIIEIGTGLHGKMSGDSILVWSQKTNAQKIIALDLEKDRINEVKKATVHCPHVEALLMDGIEYLNQFDREIDLLYLDFWVPDPEDTLPGTGRAEAYLKAYNAARDKMNEHSMILIDDTDHVHPWKHTYIIPEARKDRFRVIYEGRQTLLKR